MTEDEHTDGRRGRRAGERGERGERGEVRAGERGDADAGERGGGERIDAGTGERGESSVGGEGGEREDERGGSDGRRGAARAAPSVDDRAATAEPARPPRTWLRLKLTLLALSAVLPFPLVGIGVYRGWRESRALERAHRQDDALVRLYAALIEASDAEARLADARAAEARRPGRVPSGRELAELVQQGALSAAEAATIAALGHQPTVAEREAELAAVLARAHAEMRELASLGLDEVASADRVLALEAAARARGELGDVAPLAGALERARSPVVRPAEGRVR